MNSKCAVQRIRLVSVLWMLPLYFLKSMNDNLTETDSTIRNGALIVLQDLSDQNFEQIKKSYLLQKLSYSCSLPFIQVEPENFGNQSRVGYIISWDYEVHKYKL